MATRACLVAALVLLAGAVLQATEADRSEWGEAALSSGGTGDNDDDNGSKWFALRNNATGLCFTAAAGSGAPGVVLLTWTCYNAPPWPIPGPAPSTNYNVYLWKYAERKAFTLTLNRGGMCATVNTPTSGSGVSLRMCEKLPLQRFTFFPPGHIGLIDPDLCLSVASGALNTPAIVVPCDLTDPKQVWVKLPYAAKPSSS